MSAPPTLQAVESAAACAWTDFLSNRVHLAAVRASPFVDGLRRLLAAESVATDTAELLVTLADLAYIAGACDGDNPRTLELAVAAYDRYIRLAPGPARANPMRMRAEALLRLRRPADAFAAFAALHARRLAQGIAEDDEVAPFRLIHDAEALEAAAAAGAEAAPRLRDRAASWRELAGRIAGDPSASAWSSVGDDTGQTNAAGSTDSTAAIPTGLAAPAPRLGDWRVRVRVGSLSRADRHLLGPEFGQPIPRPIGLPTHWRHGSPVLRPRSDWAVTESTYLSARCAVIDGLMTDSALHEVQQYAQHGAHFAATRNGYLGCFPADGATHPILLSLANELAAALHGIFAPHALALWWLFKYSECGGDGIGLHADPAAVNVNIWLTEEVARVSGGGLLIYNDVPPLEQPVAAANHEFDSPAAEEALRLRLRGQAGVTEVPYACNRAVVFVSDQYHESQPFQFRPGYTNRRCNLTLLFGDRWNVRPPGGNGGGGGAPDAGRTGGQADRGETTGAGGWDIFD